MSDWPEYKASVKIVVKQGGNAFQSACRSCCFSLPSCREIKVTDKDKKVLTAYDLCRINRGSHFFIETILP